MPLALALEVAAAVAATVATAAAAVPAASTAESFLVVCVGEDMLVWCCCWNGQRVRSKREMHGAETKLRQPQHLQKTIQQVYKLKMQWRYHIKKKINLKGSQCAVSCRKDNPAAF